MAKLARDTVGMRSIFWIWTVVIFGGLAFMVVTPLGGR